MVKKILALLFLIILFLLIHPVSAQNSNEIKWQEVPLQSGEVAEIVIVPSNPNIMYAGFEVNSHSLYKSTDAGKSWIRIQGGGDHTKDVAVSPKDPSIVYFAMSEALATTDRSFTSTVKSKYGGGPPGFVAETQNILVTGLPAGGSAVSFSSVEVFEGDGNVIYAARRGGEGMGGVNPKIYKTQNRGQTWNEVEVDLHTVNVLAPHPKDLDTILIGSRDGIYQSSDLGKNLKKLSKLSDVISIEFNLKDPNIIVAASSYAVVKSTDGGKSWKEISGDLKDIHRVRISRSNPNILYASTFNGVFKSDDGGSNWRDVTGNLKAKNIQIVEIHPQNPDIAFVGHSTLWSSVRSEERYKTGLYANQGIYKTEDGGKTWVRSDNGIREYKFEEVAVNPSKQYEAWVASPASRGGYKTEDGGHNWYQSQTPTFHYPMRVKYSFQNPDKIFATGWQNNAPFSFSNDGGVNWKLVNEHVFFKAVTRGKDLLGSNTGGGAIHLHGLAVDPKNDKIVYAGSISDVQSPVGFPLKGAHIFKSKDGGSTWEESDEGFAHEQDTAIHDITIDPHNNTVIYVSTTRHESRKGLGVYKSTDGGKSWTSANDGLSGEALSVNTLIVNPKNTSEVVVATFGGLYRSENGGDSWHQTSSSSSFDVEYVIDESNTLYASTQQGVLRSLDFGMTWSPFGSGLPAGEGHGIGVDRTGNVIYAAVEGGLFVARLSDVPANIFESKIGENPYGFGEMRRFGPGGFAGNTPNISVIVPIIVVILIAGLIIGFVIWKKKHPGSAVTTKGVTDDFDV